MGKKRKADTSGKGTDFKIKFIKESESKPILVCFPSAYKPQSGNESWSFHEHAETDAHAIIAETVRFIINDDTWKDLNLSKFYLSNNTCSELVVQENNVDLVGTAVEPREEEHSCRCEDHESLNRATFDAFWVSNIYE